MYLLNVAGCCGRHLVAQLVSGDASWKTGCLESLLGVCLGVGLLGVVGWGLRLQKNKKNFAGFAAALKE